MLRSISYTDIMTMSFDRVSGCTDCQESSTLGPFPFVCCADSIHSKRLTGNSVSLLSIQGGQNTPESIEDLFENHGFEIEFDNEGNISGAEFPMAAARMATSFLDVIEPYVEDGTEMEFEAEDGDCWTWPSKDENEIEDSLEDASFTGYFNIDAFDDIKEDFFNLFEEKCNNPGVSEDEDIPTFFTAFGLSEPSMDDEQFSWEDEDIDLSSFKISYMDFLRIMGPYDTMGSLGHIIDDEGWKNVSYGYDGLEFESSW